MIYGSLPKYINEIKAECTEYMHYQYMLIKLRGSESATLENRLNCFSQIVSDSMKDFLKEFGEKEFLDNYIYITAKHRYQVLGFPMNRGGYHSDGFMTNDINYIWYDKSPTIFNSTPMQLSQNDELSLQEMEAQALAFNEVTYPEYSLLRLNQYNIHKVNPNFEGLRTFVKISFSKDKYDLLGNSINELLDYRWAMRPRKIERNIPQILNKKVK